MATELTRRTGGGELVPGGYGGWGLFDHLRREMNQLFESFPRAWSGNLFSGVALSVPVDVDEADNLVCVEAELPGMAEKDIELTLTPSCDALVIKGEKKLEHEKRDGSMYYGERAYGRFERTIPLPSRVDSEKVQAHFKNGILTVEMRKAEGTTRKSIPIKAS